MLRHRMWKLKYATDINSRSIKELNFVDFNEIWFYSTSKIWIAFVCKRTNCLWNYARSHPLIAFLSWSERMFLTSCSSGIALFWKWRFAVHSPATTLSKILRRKSWIRSTRCSLEYLEICASSLLHFGDDFARFLICRWSPSCSPETKWMFITFFYTNAFLMWRWVRNIKNYCMIFLTRYECRQHMWIITRPSVDKYRKRFSLVFFNMLGNFMSPEK